MRLYELKTDSGTSVPDGELIIELRAANGEWFIRKLWAKLTPVQPEQAGLMSTLLGWQKEALEIEPDAVAVCALFTAILLKNPKGGFTSTCPEIPGAISQGKTEEDALMNLRDAAKGILIVQAEQPPPPAPLPEAPKRQITLTKSYTAWCRILDGLMMSDVDAYRGLRASLEAETRDTSIADAPSSPEKELSACKVLVEHHGKGLEPPQPAPDRAFEEYQKWQAQSLYGESQECDHGLTPWNAAWTAATQAAGREMRELLGLRESWDLLSTLAKLREAAEILLRQKDYDGHGWEAIQIASKQAVVYEGRIRAALETGKEERHD